MLQVIIKYQKYKQKRREVYYIKTSFLIESDSPSRVIIILFVSGNFIFIVSQRFLVRMEKLSCLNVTNNNRLINTPEIIVLFIVFIILKNNPDVVFIRVFVITETRNFLLFSDRARDLMRMQVSTSGDVLETKLILETDFIATFLFSYLRWKNNPGTFVTRITFDSESLSIMVCEINPSDCFKSYHYVNNYHLLTRTRFIICTFI